MSYMRIRAGNCLASGCNGNSLICVENFIGASRQWNSNENDNFIKPTATSLAQLGGIYIHCICVCVPIGCACCVPPRPLNAHHHRRRRHCKCKCKTQRINYAIECLSECRCKWRAPKGALELEPGIYACVCVCVCILNTFKCIHIPWL